MTHADRPIPALCTRNSSIALLILLVIGAFYLAREHSVHASLILPYLILLLCPLLHLFGHHPGPHRQRHSETATPKDEIRK